MLILYKSNETHFHGGNTGSNPVGDANHHSIKPISPVGFCLLAPVLLPSPSQIPFPPKYRNRYFSQATASNGFDKKFP